MPSTHSTVVLLGMAIVAMLIGSFTFYIYGPTMYRMSVTGYAREVPVQLGYDEAKDYWLISATVNEKSAFKLCIDAGATEDLSGDNVAKAGSNIDIVLNPLCPNSKTDMTTFTLTYLSKRGLFTYGDEYTQVPIYDINDAGWLTTVSYEVGVFKNSNKLIEQTVKLNYQEPRTISLSTSGGTVLIDNLGMLPQGVEVPSGDLVAVQDPNSVWHIFNKADVIKMMNDWLYHAMTTGYPMQTFTWANVWQWTVSQNALPKDVNMVHVEKFEFEGTMQYFKLTYASDIAFVGFITVMIPDSMADTIIVALYTPIPKIVDIDPDELPKIDEGKSTQLLINVRNDGMEGTISCVVASSAYVASPLTSTSKTFKEGETYLFKYQMIALNVETDIATDISIRVEGRGGSDSRIIHGSIKNVAGYTPPSVGDSDGDGIPDNLDWDDDNDWIPDFLEPVVSNLMFVAVIVVIVALAAFMAFGRKPSTIVVLGGGTR